MAEGNEPRTAEPPDEFDVYELIVLRRPPNAPALDDAAEDLLQRQHLGHFAAMKDAGYLKVAGPLSEQPDDSWRGICFYQVGSLSEARRLAESDPAVHAGRFIVDAMNWFTPKGALVFPT
ncbi:MAG: hypothetical protein WA359_09780 [Acidimicrobiales bacterium]